MSRAAKSGYVLFVAALTRQTETEEDTGHDTQHERAIFDRDFIGGGFYSGGRRARGSRPKPSQGAMFGDV